MRALPGRDVPKSPGAQVALRPSRAQPTRISSRKQPSKSGGGSFGASPRYVCLFVTVVTARPLHAPPTIRRRIEVLADFAGSWTCTAYTAVSSENPQLQFDLLALGGSLTATVDSDGSFTGQGRRDLNPGPPEPHSSGAGWLHSVWLHSTRFPAIRLCHKLSQITSFCDS